jgi:hypothetical protein
MRATAPRVQARPERRGWSRSSGPAGQGLGPGRGRPVDPDASVVHGRRQADPPEEDAVQRRRVGRDPQGHCCIWAKDVADESLSGACSPREGCESHSKLSIPDVIRGVQGPSGGRRRS